MSKSANLTKSFSYMSLSNVVVIACTAFSTILLARYLEPTELGYYVAGQAFVEMFSFFFNMGFKNSMLQVASTNKDDFKEGLRTALGNALVIRAFVCMPVAGIIYLVASNVNHSDLMLKVILANILIILCKSFTNVFGIARRALNQFKLVAGLAAMNKVLSLAIIIVVFKYLGGIEMLLICQVLVALIKVIVSFVTTIRLCPPKIELNKIKGMLKESFLFGVFDYLDDAQSKIDRLMLNYMLGPAAVAFYSIPAKLNRVIKIIPTSITQVFSPRLFKQNSDKEKYWKTINKIILLATATGLSIAAGIYFFSKPVLSLAFAAKYTKAIELAPLFAFVAVIWFLNLVPNLILATRSDHKGRNTVQLISIIANIALNFIWIPQFGIEGAIWATIAANSLKFACLQTRVAMTNG